MSGPPSPVGTATFRCRGSDAIVAIDWTTGLRLLAATVDGTILIDHEWVSGPSASADDPARTGLVAACWTGISNPVVASVDGLVTALHEHPTNRRWCRPLAVPEPVAAIAPSGLGVVVAHGTTVTITSADADAVTLDPQIGRLRSLAAVSASYAVAVGAGGAALFDTVFGTPDTRVELDGAISVAVDREAGHVAVGDVAGTIQVLRIGDDGGGRELSGYPDPVRLLAWSDRPSGLVALADDELTFWPLVAGTPSEVPTSATGSGAELSALTTSPSGSLVATGDVDGRVDVWSLHALGRPAWSSDRLDGEVTVLRWSPDGTFLAAGTTTGDVVVWSREAIA